MAATPAHYLPIVIDTVGRTLAATQGPKLGHCSVAIEKSTGEATDNRMITHDSPAGIDAASRRAKVPPSVSRSVTANYTAP